MSPVQGPVVEGLVCDEPNCLIVHYNLPEHGRDSVDSTVVAVHVHLDEGDSLVDALESCSAALLSSPVVLADRWVEVYEGEDGQHYWRRVAGRGNLPDATVADGAQGYADHDGALEAAYRENPGMEVRGV